LRDGFRTLGVRDGRSADRGAKRTQWPTVVRSPQLPHCRADAPIARHHLVLQRIARRASCGSRFAVGLRRQAGSQSLPYVADRPTRGSLGTSAHKGARTRDSAKDEQGSPAGVAADAASRVKRPALRDPPTGD
jgi:hypothetical protein